ncbi:DUF2388 domain-containing protein [Bdellovibrio sp. HCB209]|uniref:DUF2388 domain-containing protein n=1 Tax=Bdellovibrio sp. HCB209 TaxID=3394354 RepID=UPI0039B4D7EB
MKNILSLKLSLLTSFIFAASISYANDPQMASGAIIMSPLLTISGPFITTADSLNSEAYKVLIESKDDAATFIASEGQIRGARVLRAFELIRKVNPKLRNSDMELAEAILNL